MTLRQSRQSCQEILMEQTHIIPLTVAQIRWSNSRTIVHNNWMKTKKLSCTKTTTTHKIVDKLKWSWWTHFFLCHVVKPNCRQTRFCQQSQQHPPRLICQIFLKFTHIRPRFSRSGGKTIVGAKSQNMFLMTAWAHPHTWLTRTMSSDLTVFACVTIALLMFVFIGFDPTMGLLVMSPGMVGGSQQSVSSSIGCWLVGINLFCHAHNVVTETVVAHPTSHVAGDHCVAVFVFLVWVSVKTVVGLSHKVQ